MYVQNVVMFVEHSVMGTCNAFFEFQKRNFTKIMKINRALFCKTYMKKNPPQKCDVNEVIISSSLILFVVL